MLFIFDLDGTLIESFLEEITCPKCDGHRYDAMEYAHSGTWRDCTQCRGKGTWLRLRDEGYDRVEWLPRRRSKLAMLANEGHSIAITTNQTGVFYGFQTADQVSTKLKRVVIESGLDTIRTYACLDPNAGCRKPNARMLHEAMLETGSRPWETIFVGDMETDRQAAERAGVAYVDADVFFRH